jgi:PAS domain S-box-containing protein
MARTARVLVRGDAEGLTDALDGDGLRVVDGEPVDCVVDAGPLDGLEPLEGGVGVPRVVLYDPADPAVATRALELGAARVVAVTGAPEDAALVRAAVERAVDTDGEPSRVADADLLRDGIDELSDVFFLFDQDLRFRAWNARLAEVTGYEDSEIEGMEPTDFIAPDDREAVTRAIGDAIAEGRVTVEAAFLTADGEELAYEFTGAALRADDGTLQGVVGIGRDITERKARERELRAQAERLARLDRINRVIRSTLRDLTAAETREQIEQAVVDRLSAADPYRFAWIGGFEGGDRVEPRVWAGDGAAYLDARGGDGDGVTAESAVRNGEVTVVQRIADHPGTEGWRGAALDHGFAAAAAVPLSNRETTLGVLCVYADQPDAFTDEEQAVLRELGATIANAVTAAERRRALMADLTVELELAVDGDALFPVALSRAADCRVELVGGVPESDGSVRQFYRVEGVDREAALAAAEAVGVDATVVREADEGFVVRVRDDAALGAALAEWGGRVVEGYATGGEGRLVVQLPPSADVRAVVETLDDRYGAQLLARREQARETGTRDRLAALTDRQRTVLETAFHAGYFDSPRANTGAEVAESLDISTPTFHEHLRAAERKLVAASLDEDE